MTDRPIIFSGAMVRALLDGRKTMTRRLASRREAMVKARDRNISTPPKGRLATGWFATWSRQVGSLAQSVAKLDRLKSKLPKAIERVRYLTARAKINDAKRERQAAFIAAMTVRLDALREVAPTIDAKWKAERKQEAKRIKARKKLLRDRLSAEPVSTPVIPAAPEDWLKPTVEQPADVSFDFTPSVAPEGYQFQSLLDAEPLPREWTARHVGARLIEAQRVVRIIPETIGPKSFGRAWPAYSPDADDLAGQEPDAKFRPRASAYEIARAMEAINWPIQFLSNRGGYAIAALIYWADEATDPDADNPPHDLLETIATALQAAKEPIR